MILLSYGMHTYGLQSGRKLEFLVFRVEEIKVRNFRVEEPWGGGGMQNAVCIMFDSDARQAV
jgi:hypothetical protein